MPIEFIRINGPNPNIDYGSFEGHFRSILERNCREAKIFFLNKFPVTIHGNLSVDVVLIICIKDSEGNYFRIYKNNKWVYLHNLILPISFVHHQTQNDLNLNNDSVFVSSTGEVIDYSDELNDIRFAFKRYLNNRCGFSDVFINPVAFILNDYTSLVQQDCIVNSSLSSNSFMKYLKEGNLDIFRSYSVWNEDFDRVQEDVSVMIDQASRDSEFGFLTRKKIDLLTSRLRNASKLRDRLGQQLIVIKGTAGSGKTNDLLHLGINRLINGDNSLLLTYNNLLVYELSNIIHAYYREKSIERIGEFPVSTLHSFFYRRLLKMGILHLLSEQRIDELEKKLGNRLRTAKRIILSHLGEDDVVSNSNKIRKLINHVYSLKDLNKEEKDLVLGFLQYLRRHSLLNDLDYAIESFTRLRLDKLRASHAKEFFLEDYLEALEEGIMALDDPEGFYKKYNISDKSELLSAPMNLREDRIIESGGNLSLEYFKQKHSQILRAQKRARIVFVDEGQDCHKNEREFLYRIFETNKVVVAHGGKEQMIRYGELCDWTSFKQRPVNNYSRTKPSKTYRCKKEIADLCNFIAGHYDISLDLEPLDSPDKGQVIIDLRIDMDEEPVSDLFNWCMNKGEVNQCSPYESLLILVNEYDIEYKEVQEELIVNEYDNIELTPSLFRNKWKYYMILNDQIDIWDGTLKNKSELIQPGFNQVRMIYYESCRGLEAWTTYYAGLDDFFEAKKLQDIAEHFELDNIFLNNESRKAKYAATWILMALTRSVDTAFINLTNPESELYKLLMAYAHGHPDSIEVITN